MYAKSSDSDDYPGIRMRHGSQYAQSQDAPSSLLTSTGEQCEAGSGSFDHSEAGYSTRISGAQSP